MSTTTSKGIPIPEPTDANNVPAAIAALAGWVNDNPGIATMDTATRDALTGDDVWEGRTIYNTTTRRHEINITGEAGAAAWGPTVPEPQVTVRTSPGTSAWIRPAGATRIRIILIGAGGRGAAGATGRGGGGGAIVDITLPGSFAASSCGIAVGRGDTIDGNGGPSTINLAGASSGLGNATLIAGGGRSGVAPETGTGGSVVFPDGRPGGGDRAWLGGPGGTAPPSDGSNLTGSAAPGAGHGATSLSAASMTSAGHGAGIIAAAGAAEFGLGGAGGASRGAPGYAPGGGGAGGGAANSQGADGAVAIISYFD